MTIQQLREYIRKEAVSLLEAEESTKEKPKEKPKEEPKEEPKEKRETMKLTQKFITTLKRVPTEIDQEDVVSITTSIIKAFSTEYSDRMKIVRKIKNTPGM